MGDTIERVSDFFKNFSDYTRLKIVKELLNEEFSVTELSERLGISQTAVSHQLRILREARIVKYRREAQQIFYTIDDKHIKEMLMIITQRLRLITQKKIE